MRKKWRKQEVRNTGNLPRTLYTEEAQSTVGKITYNIATMSSQDTQFRVIKVIIVRLSDVVVYV